MGKIILYEKYREYAKRGDSHLIVDKKEFESGKLPTIYDVAFATKDGEWDSIGGHNKADEEIVGIPTAIYGYLLAKEEKKQLLKPRTFCSNTITYIGSCGQRLAT